MTHHEHQTHLHDQIALLRLALKDAHRFLEITVALIDDVAEAAQALGPAIDAKLAEKDAKIADLTTQLAAANSANDPALQAILDQLNADKAKVAPTP